MKQLVPFFLIIFCTVTIFSELWATSYAEPKKQVIYSYNKKFFVILNPKSEIHKVYKADESHAVVWSFHWQVWHDTWAISDTGGIVVWISWKYVKKNDLERPCVAIFDWEGVRKVYSQKDLSSPRRYKRGEKGPIGAFWRIWYEAIEVEKDFIRIETPGGQANKISLKDGRLL